MPADFAPGLPRKEVSHDLPSVETPRVWEFGVHDHHAERRGRHFDLRLGDPESGHAHSWAMKAEWPQPGERTWAIQQPTHTVGYMDFKGRIEEGYGKGNVHLHDRAKTEVLSSRPGHINFNLYRSTGPEEYTLHQVTGKNWVLYNRTLDQKKRATLPSSKPDYREVALHQAPVDDPNYLFSAKIDDAHNLFVLPAAGEQIRVVSYRTSKKNPTGVIEHTHKVPGLLGEKVPAGLGSTILRGGLYAIDPQTGEAVAPHHIAGILNSDVWKSREKQKEMGALLPVLYDVVKFKGKSLEGAPYREKLRALQEVEKALPHLFHLPRMASTPEAKRKLLADIASGELPETKEGIVAWHLHSAEAPIKAKVKEDHDVYIQGFYPGEGKYKGRAIGGFYFSHEPGGDPVGKVGTGISDAQRRDMFEHPDRYIGMVARVETMKGGRYSSGALRTASFQNFHLDKNEQARLDLVKHAEQGLHLVFLWGRAIA